MNNSSGRNKSQTATIATTAPLITQVRLREPFIVEFITSLFMDLLIEFIGKLREMSLEKRTLLADRQ
jgi:hypothetical protein